MLAADDSPLTASLPPYLHPRPGRVAAPPVFLFFFYRFCPSDSKLKPIRRQALAVGKDGDAEAFGIFDLEAVTDGRPLPVSQPPRPLHHELEMNPHLLRPPIAVTPLGLNF